MAIAAAALARQAGAGGGRAPVAAAARDGKANPRHVVPSVISVRCCFVSAKLPRDEVLSSASSSGGGSPCRVPTTKMVTEYIQAVGAANASIFSGCSSLQDEFKVIKKSYHDALRTTHPDKGGSAEAFRAVQEAFAYLKTLHDNGQVLSYSTYLVVPRNDQFARQKYGYEAQSLPRSPGVQFTGWSYDCKYQFYTAILPYAGVRGGQQFSVDLAGLKFALTYPPNAMPGSAIPFFVLEQDVAEHFHAVSVAQFEAERRAAAEAAAYYEAERRAGIRAAERKKERRVTELLVKGTSIAMEKAMKKTLKEGPNKRKLSRDNVSNNRGKENEGMHPQKSVGGKTFTNDAEPTSVKSTPKYNLRSKKTRRAFGNVKNIA